MVVVVGVEREADRGRRLERSRRADGEKVMDLPDRVFQLLEKHVFQQVALRARLESAIDVFVSVVSSEHDDSRFSKLLSNLRNRIDAAHHRHAQVHQRDVRLMFAV